MSAAAISNPALQGDSKNARKKKAKGDTGTPSSEAAADKHTGLAGDVGANGGEGGGELQFLRDLHKNIRNAKKKIAATQKVDSIIAEHPGKSLDELLATKKINTDQKLQAERKPTLLANLQELEEELDRYKKIEESLAQQHESEKSSLKLEHAKEISALRESIAKEATVNGSHQTRQNLLNLSKFLRAAAAKRQDGDETAEESRAFEGALLLVYGGDQMAVQAMENIIDGSDELIPTVEGTKTTLSYKQIRGMILGEDEAPVEEEVPDQPVVTTGTTASGTDPTTAHASLTEMDDVATIETATNGAQSMETPTVPTTGLIDGGAANAAAESSWNNMTSSAASGPDDWVQVHQIPRDPAETETGTHGAPAAATSTQSWAEDVPTEPVSIPVHPAPPANDGFHEVHHGRTRGRGAFQGEYRGRGRGGFRGDRGDGSFRGRGGFRGDRGGEGGPRGRGRGGYRGPRGARGESGPSA